MPAKFAISILVLLCGLLGANAATAHDARQAVDEALRAAVDSTQVSDVPAPTEDERFAAVVRDQAALEVQLGLRFYAEYDDYRAITALRRYQFLDGTPSSKYLAALMIGQIYHRNEKPELATISFEEAAQAAETDYYRTFAYLMALQETCLPLSFYAQCRQRLAALAQTPMEPATRELIDYQVLYTDVVLRSEYVTPERIQMLSDERLVKKAEGLLAANEAFHDIPLKKPWLAGTLSGIVPGLGQVYNGRPIDGLVSFLVNGAFATATYLSFTRAKSIPLGVISAVFLAGFYSGNIVNAVTDARKINANRYLDFFDELKKDYWPRVAFEVEESTVLFTYGFDWPGPTLSSRAEEAAAASEDSE